jgi:thioredoxin-like negative regulator of GroEL
MDKFMLCGIIFACAILAVALWWILMRKKNTNNFTSLDSSSMPVKKYRLVLLFTESCGYCKQLMPEWEKTKAQLNGVIDIKEYNCSSDPSAMSHYNVKGVPSILLESSDGQVMKYDGQRIADAIISFVQTYAKK